MYSGAAVFVDRSEFEAYCRTVMDRLEREYEERLRFLRESVERLRELLRMAEAVADADTRADLESRIRTAEGEIAELEALTAGRGRAAETGGPPAALGSEPGEARNGSPAAAPSPALGGGMPEWAALLWAPAAGSPAPAAESPGPPAFEWVAPEKPAGAAPPAPESVPAAGSSAAPVPPADPLAPVAETRLPEPSFVWPDPEPPAEPEPAATALDWDVTFRAAPRGAAPVAPTPPLPEADRLSHDAAHRGAPTPALELEVRIGARRFDWSLAGRDALVGRRDPVTGRVPDLDLWPDFAVSRRHARIGFRDGRYYLADLNSTNGTEVNGRLLRPGEERCLASGDEILLGEETRLRVLRAP